jgi:hypothetical protein
MSESDSPESDMALVVLETPSNEFCGTSSKEEPSKVFEAEDIRYQTTSYSLSYWQVSSSVWSIYY